MNTDYKKLTINLAPDLHAELEGMAEKDGISLSEMFRRMVALYRFAQQNGPHQ